MDGKVSVTLAAFISFFLISISFADLNVLQPYDLHCSYPGNPLKIVKRGKVYLYGDSEKQRELILSDNAVEYTNI